MTLRLVALMSVVLLLSLAAFGLMMNHYQDQVMDEVARTVSETSRATLRTLELSGSGNFVRSDDDAGANHWFTWTTVGDQGQAVEAGVPPAHGPVVIDSVRSVHVAQMSMDRDKILERTGEVVGGVAVICESTDGELTPEDCVSSDEDALAELTDRLFIDIDDVHAESDPAGNLTLKIKTFRPEAPVEAGTVIYEEKNEFVQDAAETVVFKRHEDIRLPIPVQEYDSLFASARSRSLWMFVGVFLVGTVLSAGLASRFTRPVRRLDSAIRRLSDGNLDVQVRARGDDEMARLGSAFNEMTRSLRANRQRSREMVRREKHSALGRLAAGVAHDIRNPLHSIGLTLQHLRDTCRPEAEERGGEFDRSLDIIRGEIRRLDQLVGNFLQFARSEARQRHPVDLNELLAETARLVRKEAEWRKIEVQLKLDQSAPTIEADGEALRSSILNLVLNSFEAMPDGGRLTLSLGVENGEALLEVSDTGEGIADEDQDRVFDFAFTTKEGGNGLGLAMVYQCVVEDHGGRVSLDSGAGNGTRVRVVLPLDKKTEDHA